MYSPIEKVARNDKLNKTNGKQNIFFKPFISHKMNSAHALVNHFY